MIYLKRRNGVFVLIEACKSKMYYDFGFGSIRNFKFIFYFTFLFDFNKLVRHQLLLITLYPVNFMIKNLHAFPSSISIFAAYGYFEHG